MELPKNKSVINKNLFYKDKIVTGGDNKETVVSYKDSKESFSNYQLIKDPEKQFVAMQLAALIVPVAPVFKSKVENYPVDRNVFLSEDVSTHSEFLEHNLTGSRVNKLLLDLVLGDDDHQIEGGRNIKNGVFYDFDRANFTNYLTPEEFSKHYSDDNLFKYPWLNLSQEEKINFVEKLNYFESHLSDAEGLGFVESLCKKAEYFEFSPEHVRNVLLSRILNTREMLEKLNP